MTTYSQLCGAVGTLKTAGVELDYDRIFEQLRQIAALNTAESSLEMNEAAAPLLRKYRDMCLERGLIRPGELFDWRDSESLATPLK